MQQHALHQVDLAHCTVLHQGLLFPRAQVRFRVSVGVVSVSGQHAQPRALAIADCQIAMQAAQNLKG
eukprot:1004331-Rhodomonas_salina.1